MGEEAADYVNRVFQKLIAVCPAWKNSADGDPTNWANMYKIELVAALKDAGVTKGEQISKGIAETRQAGKPFLPAPGEFAKACRGGDLKGLSHQTAAYRLVDKRNLLPAPKADKESALSIISSMKKAIAGK